MAIIVSILGVFIVLIGAAGIAKPKCLIDLVNHWDGRTRFWIAIIVRVVLGIVLLAVAPGCRLPMLVRIIGVIAIVAALCVLILGRARLDAFIRWWLLRPALIRVSAIFAVAFGALLVYAGA